ncbi:MAG: hypothetical protein ACYDC8_16100 [Gammaproteobacteria bacterium]
MACISIRIFLFVSLWVCCASVGTAASLPAATLAIAYPISSPYYPVILRGAQLAPLLGENRAQIVAYVFHKGRLTTIPFQIDRRDAHGQLLLDDAMPASLVRAPQFIAQDECVFMAADVGERASVPGTTEIGKTVELELRDPKSAQRGWIYLVVSPTVPVAASAPEYVHYLAAQDALQSATYRLGFSHSMPMLAQSLQWFDPHLNAYGTNMIDIMKIRHYGRFLRGFSFRRGVEDYRSALVGTRSGPVRVIRRTENSIRVLLGFRSPTITVDYIGYAHAILADIRLDVPFRNAWFFSDLVSVTTWDGNDSPDYPLSHVYSRSLPEGFTIDGHMNEAKRRFNASGDGAFALVNRYGTLLVTMDFAAGEPIQRAVYLVDDRTALDPPENIPGQFGNIGFRMTGWEKLARGTHHLTYRALLVNGVSVADGLRLLEDAPPFY